MTQRRQTLTAAPRCLIALASLAAAPAVSLSAPADDAPSAGAHFGEQVVTYTLDPNVTVHINRPSREHMHPGRPTHLVIFALPNGNTIPHAIGAARRPDREWKFSVQHIGAQIRWLRRHASNHRNLVVAYVEAGNRSWPTWRRRTPNADQIILRVVQSIRERVPQHDRVSLTCHSGGGAFVLGFISAVDTIPDWIERIVFLDANYEYRTEAHALKLLNWVKGSDRRCLGVVAYDDRRTFRGGEIREREPDRSTYHQTHALLADIRQGLTLQDESVDEYDRWRAADGRVDIVLWSNPGLNILHTILVEKNGLIHALTFGSPAAKRLGFPLMNRRLYDDLIQP